MKRQIGICDNIVVVMDVYKSDIVSSTNAVTDSVTAMNLTRSFLSIFVLQSIADITHGFYCHAGLKQLQLFAQV